MSKVIKLEKDTGRNWSLSIYGYGDKLAVTIGFKSKAAAKRAEKALHEMQWLVTAR